jgi:hypothetical protein
MAAYCKAVAQVALDSQAELAEYKAEQAEIMADLNMSLNLSDIRARLDAVEPATTIEDWIASDFERPLAAGTYTVTEPITFTREFGKTLKGPSHHLVDPITWGYYNWPNSPESQCIILFDLDENVPGITMSGCGGMRFEGINFCRTTPGPIIKDTNATGANSFMIEFYDCGFFCRQHVDVNYTDPYGGAGVVDDITGYTALLAEGTNGTDNYRFDSCDFFRLDIPVHILSPQCTKTQFNYCAFRRCNYMMWVGHSDGAIYSIANPTFISCTRYDSGPVVFDRTGSQGTNMTWVGGWLDCGTAMKSLVDFSRWHYGSLAYVGGAGKTLSGAYTHEPLVVPSDTDGWTSLFMQGKKPQGQPLLPEGYELNGTVINVVP